MTTLTVYYLINAKQKKVKSLSSRDLDDWRFLNERQIQNFIYVIMLSNLLNTLCIGYFNYHFYLICISKGNFSLKKVLQILMIQICKVKSYT